MTELDNNNLDELIKEGTNILLFNAKWCGACKLVEPKLKEISKNYNIIKIDTDKYPKIMFKYKIINIPSLIVTKDGKVTNELSGYHTDLEIDEFINAI